MKAASGTALERHYQAQRSRKIMIGGCIISEKRERRRSDWKLSIELMRLREIEKVISSRHDARVPDPEDTDDRDTCLAYVQAAALALSGQDMTGWCARWAPWVTEGEIAAIENMVGKRRRMMRADGVAGLLMVTMQERDRLGLKTIGACDMSKADRISLAKERKRARDRKRMEGKRVGERRKDRQSYEGQSMSRLKPWEAEGVSRATWYRRQRETSVSRVDIYTNGDIPVSNDEGYAPAVPSVSMQDAGGVAVRHEGLGDHPPAGRQGAEPNGKGDKEEAA